MRILIIEDRPEQAGHLAELVAPMASEVIIANTMAEARKVIMGAPEPPEIITVDLGLPDSLREETIEKELSFIRANAPRSLVIVITGILTEPERDRMLRLGADGAWEKLDVSTHKTFMSQLRELVLALLAKPGKPAMNLKLLELVAKSISAEGRYMPDTTK